MAAPGATMLLILLLLAALAVIFGPWLWARWILRRYAAERADFPGTGGELARHLLDRAGLQGYRCEQTDAGDHFDPSATAVRLSPAHFDGRSLSAVVVAAHEVGHALQHRDGFPALALRSRLVVLADWAQRIGAAIAMVIPVGVAFWSSPRLGLAFFVLGLLTMGVAVVAHVVTLPVELDASFNKALPILDQGGYVPRTDLPAARRILTACALTYVAAALQSLLNFGRWMTFLRWK